MKKWFSGVILIVLALSSPVSSWASAGEKLKVVVSIKPIHALVAGVMQGVAQPALLLQGGGSPHGYVLRPSDAKLLANADVVIWVGHSLESFLEKPLATLAREARQLELLEALQEQLLPFRAGLSWESHDTDLAEHHHAQGERNPHLWLSPLLAKQIVVRVAATLSTIDPSNQAVYRHNAEQLQRRLDDLDRQLANKLKPVQTTPYIVFHDAYQYFETAYGLNAVGSITINPERMPGARRISEIRNKIKSLNARCVFSEPQFEPRLVATITEGTEARTGTLDPLGVTLPVGPESYFVLLHEMADNLLAGLR